MGEIFLVILLFSRVIVCTKSYIQHKSSKAMNSEEACDAHASLLPASFKPLLSLTCAKAATSVAVLSACFSYITSAYPTVTGGTKSRPTSKVRIHPPQVGLWPCSERRCYFVP